MHLRTLLTAVSLAVLSLTACGRIGSDGNAASSATDTTRVADAAATPTGVQNVARLRLDGELWQANREFFALLAPVGTSQRLMLGASLGPKDATEQTFNLNLTDVNGPGTYVVGVSAAIDNAIQLANWKPSRYLVGGSLGAEVTVRIETLIESPLTVVATFSGTMVANDGTTIQVTDGEFRYRE